MHLRILIVESDPEDLLFVEEAIREVEQCGLWTPWAEVETLAASTWMETAALLPREAVDVILLNPKLSDRQGVTLFRSLQSIAPQSPVLLLIEAEDRDLALHLVREGAQDFLLKKQLDCVPLAHAIRNALERQRVLAAVRATTMTDPLTNLLHRGAFHALAERDRQLAAHLGRRMLVLVAEPQNQLDLDSVLVRQNRDLLLVETADFLRGLGGPMGVLERISEARFAMALIDTPGEPVEETWFYIRSAATQRRIATGCAIFSPEDPAHLDSLLNRAEADLRLPALMARPAAVRT